LLWKNSLVFITACETELPPPPHPPQPWGPSGGTCSKPHIPPVRREGGCEPPCPTGTHSTAPRRQAGGAFSPTPHVAVPGGWDALTSADLRTRGPEGFEHRQVSLSLHISPASPFLAPKSCTSSLPRFGGKAPGLLSVLSPLGQGHRGHRHLPKPARFKRASVCLMLLSWERFLGAKSLPEPTCSSAVPAPWWPRFVLGPRRTRSPPTLRPRGEKGFCPPAKPKRDPPKSRFLPRAQIWIPWERLWPHPSSGGGPSMGRGAPCLPLASSPPVTLPRRNHAPVAPPTIRDRRRFSPGEKKSANYVPNKKPILV